MLKIKISLTFTQQSALLRRNVKFRKHNLKSCYKSGFSAIVIKLCDHFHELTVELKRPWTQCNELKDDC